MKLTIQSTLDQLRAAGFPAPVPEYRFHPTRHWRADFAWVRNSVLDGKPYGILWEVEGGTCKPGGGRHNRPGGYEQDVEKYNEAAMAGWTVIRSTTAQVENGQALAWLERALRAAGFGVEHG